METIIIEIRAGTGGDEAALFVGDLLKMYEKYSQSQGWRVVIIDKSLSDLGGYKQVNLEVTGEGVFNKMKYEAGVHRVQRIPKTEKSSRIHTSTISVAVLKKTKENDVQVKQSDLSFDFFKSSGKGGQNVNKRQTAIRITHAPSGLVVTSQTQRNLEQNRKTALANLQGKLDQAKNEKASSEIIEERRSQIGGADRSEKIRTYNFPQNRLTDHRLNKSFHNLEQIIEGKIDKVIHALENSFSASN